MSFVTSSGALQAVVNVGDYAERPEEVAGTPEREEFEFKFAFSGDFHQSGAEIVKLFQERIDAAIQNAEFGGSTLIGREYFTDPNFKAFAFKDIYFDTADWLVYNNSSSYRLRYRWSRRALYGRYKYMPFVKAYYPTRCEIQFKHNYVADQNKGTVQVNESRFEFRNASEPFLFDESAPPAPWPENEFVGYAQTGVYKDYRILPSALLFERLGERAVDGKVDLKPVFSVVTSRYRSHINIRDNPWASGPNPEQAFILTVDVSEFEFIQDPKVSGKILEIEAEVDRNTYTMVSQLAGMAEDSEEGSIVGAAAIFSGEVKKQLRADIGVIRNSISSVMREKLSAQPLPLRFKYARMVEAAKVQGE